MGYPFEQSCKQDFSADGFGYVLVHAGLERTVTIFKCSVRRHRQYRQVMEFAVLTNFSGRSVTIHDRHMHIHQHTVIGLLFQHVQSFLSMVGDIYKEASQLEKLTGNLLIDFIVLYQQYLRPLDGP